MEFCRRCMLEVHRYYTCGACRLHICIRCHLELSTFSTKYLWVMGDNCYQCEEESRIKRKIDLWLYENGTKKYYYSDFFMDNEFCDRNFRVKMLDVEE